MNNKIIRMMLAYSLFIYKKIYYNYVVGKYL